MLVRHVQHCVRASAVRCIRRVRLRLARVRLVSVRGFHLRDRFVPEAVRVRPHDGQDSGTFRVA